MVELRYKSRPQDLDFEKENYLFNFWLCWVFIAAHRLSLVLASRGCSLVAVFRLLIAVASLVVESGL